MSRPKTNGPDFIDVHVGNRMRMRRMMFDMSLEKMGKELGLTLQQVHEYEKGKTSIGSSRLQQAAGILGVSVSFFFETDGTAAMPSYVNRFLTSEQGRRLVKAFTRIDNAEMRRRIVGLVQEIAGSEGE
jgi:transcriptional regulator with XRE-family HTH domain